MKVLKNLDLLDESYIKWENRNEKWDTAKY